MAGEGKEKKGLKIGGEADEKKSIKKKIRYKVTDNAEELAAKGITEDDPRFPTFYTFWLQPLEEQE